MHKTTDWELIKTEATGSKIGKEISISDFVRVYLTCDLAFIRLKMNGAHGSYQYVNESATFKAQLSFNAGTSI
jgi:hypothetical protein